MTENFDTKDIADDWKLVKVKDVIDSDGFATEYAWYTNGDKHIFMFGDTDLYDPDEDYADWTCETEKEASEWFDSYTGFEDDDENYSLSDLEEFDEDYSGDADFMNKGFNRVYNIDGELED
jgi:hypothetical protein